MTESSISTPDVPADGDSLLLEFVRDRDVVCPRCDYNLRNLTQATCPECHEALHLCVGVPKMRLGWMLLAIAPGSACAVAIGIFLFIFVVEGPPPGAFPIELSLTLLFLAASAVVTIGLAVKHRAFLRLANAHQGIAALAIWTIHILAFAVFWNTV